MGGNNAAVILKVNFPSYLTENENFSFLRLFLLAGAKVRETAFRGEERCLSISAQHHKLYEDFRWIKLPEFWTTTFVPLHPFRTPQLQINDVTPAVDWRLCGIADNYFNSSVCVCVCVFSCVAWGSILLLSVGRKPPADVLFLRSMSHYMNESMLNKCVGLLTRIIWLFVFSSSPF